MRIFFAFFILLLLSCSKSTDNLPAGLQYFPDADILDQGVIFKYYYHRTKGNGQTKTDILYRKMTVKNNIIINEDYNAAFEQTYHFEVAIEGEKWKALNEKSINYRNSFTELYKEYVYEIKENTRTDWAGNEALFEKSIINDGYGSRIVTKQEENIDSITNSKRVKIIHSKRSFFSIQDNVEQEPVLLDKFSRYEEGLGLTHSLVSNDELRFEMVLDEVMTLREFDKRRNHGTHRVAYIDTLKTIDDYTHFKPCYHPSKINDYYNDKRAGFKGGKGRLRAILNKELDSDKIKGESGYLTFRFVINCKGEAGWFVTEEAGLDYQKKQFSEACRMHLYEILKSEKEWISLEIGEEARDAYVYLTFKIKNGEIIELLP